MAESALIVQVTEAEPVVGDFREQFDPSASLGVPAHITVLYPFMPPEKIDDSVISKIQGALSEHRRFNFQLSEVKRFPDTLYLAPEPALPFIVITKAIVTAFPEYPPYAGRHDSTVPHLSIASGHLDQWPIIENSITSYFRSQGDIVATCNSVELIENVSGQWQQAHEFPLYS